MATGKIPFHISQITNAACLHGGGNALWERHLKEVWTSEGTETRTSLCRFDRNVSVNDHWICLVEAVCVVVDELGDVSIRNLVSDLPIGSKLWGKNSHVWNHSNVSVKLDQSPTKQIAYLNGYEGQILAFVRCTNRIQRNDPTHNTSRPVRLSREPYTDRERRLTHSIWIMECEKRGLFCQRLGRRLFPVISL